MIFFWGFEIRTPYLGVKNPSTYSNKWRRSITTKLAFQLVGCWWRTKSDHRSLSKIPANWQLIRTFQFPIAKSRRTEKEKFICCSRLPDWQLTSCIINCAPQGQIFFQKYSRDSFLSFAFRTFFTFQERTGRVVASCERLTALLPLLPVPCMK